MRQTGVLHRMTTFMLIVAITLCFGIVIARVTSIVDANAEAEDAIYVKDFGAIIGDQKDDSMAINKAIDAAIEQGKKKVILEAGIYDFGLADNALNGAKENAYIRVIGAKGLSIEGTVDANGDPTTLLLRHNPGGNNAPLSQQIYTRDCTDLTIANIQCDTTPYYYSAGSIERISGDKVTIKICEGHPTPADWGGSMYMNMAGLYSKSKGAFYRHQVAWTEEDSSNAIPVRDIGNGMIEVGSKYLAEQLRPALRDKGAEDLVLYWFQGHINPCYRLIDNSCDTRLTYENVHILNSSAFALYTEYTEDVHYNGVKIAPPKGRYAVGARDVMKLFCCSGDIITENTTMNGFEDDGQNCHGMLAVLSKIVDSNTIEMTGVCVDERHPERFSDSDICFLSPENNGVLFHAKIKSAEQIQEGNWRFVLDRRVDNRLAGMATGNFRTAALGELGAYLPDSWTVRGCHISNTFRGLKVSANNVIIEDNVFDNNVYNIYMGAENDEWWHESCQPRHIVIRNNTFKRPLYGTSIDMDFHSYADMIDAPVMCDISIYGNKFETADIGINVRDSRDVYIYDNEFDNVMTPLEINPDSTASIHFVSKEEADGRVGEEVALRAQQLAKDRRKLIGISVGCTIIGCIVFAAMIIGIVLIVRVTKKRCNSKK